MKKVYCFFVFCRPLTKLSLLATVFFLLGNGNKIYSQPCYINDWIDVGNLSSCGATTGTLTASSTFSTDQHRWYTSPTGGSPIGGVVQGTGEEDNHVSSLTAIFTSTTTYYVSIYRASYNCETSRTAVTATIKPIPSVTTSYQQFCGGSPTVANLTATPVPSGSSVQWFTSPTGGSALASSTLLVDNTWYYAQATYNGCVSTSRSSKYVNVFGTPPAPTAPSSQNIQPNTMVYQLAVTLPANPPGHEPYEAHWYNTSTGGTYYWPGAYLPSSGYYYVATYWGETGCESATRAASYINIAGKSISVNNLNKTNNTVNEVDKTTAYPNPVKDKLFIKLAKHLKNTSVSITLYDMQGVKLYESIVTDDTEIDLSTYMPGTYILQVNDEKMSIVK